MTDEIQRRLSVVSNVPVEAALAMGSTELSMIVPDVCLVEVGGTVGDIESEVFLEALRQFATKVGMENICFVHVSLVPTVGSVGEQKTKPTQHSVKELRSGAWRRAAARLRQERGEGRAVAYKSRKICL